MTLFSRSIVALGLGLASLALPITAASAGTSVVISNCGNATVAPHTITLACGDGNRYLHGLTWSHWGTSLATGTGTLTWNTCTPNCVSGSFVSRHVTFHAALLTTTGGHTFYRELVGASSDWGQSSPVWILSPLH
jgi:ribosomal protein S27AE